MRFTPHDYQLKAVEHIVRHPFCALWLDMGLGKSAITLSAITELYARFDIQKVLIIAPKKVAETTWQSEITKWSDFSYLKVSTIMGTPAQRMKALAAKANIYILGRDSVVWLYETVGRDRWPFDMVVLDESTSFKAPSAQRFKALRKVRPYISRLVELTGTPSPNGLEDLWAQVYLLDLGKRLGTSMTAYHNRYFQIKEQVFGMYVKWAPKKGADTAIAESVKDLVVSMKSEDYLKLPDLIIDTRTIRLKAKAEYDRLEKELFLQTDEAQIEALSATALMNKLLQLSNGAVYDSEHKAHVIDDSKLEALEEMVEGLDHALVFYAYKHDAERISERLKGVRIYSGPSDLRDWNEGKIKILLAHPASTAYGLNMQQGGHHIIWFGLTWNYELYSQANARLHRQGQRFPVIVHHLVAEGTRDVDVMRALTLKDKAQDYLIDMLKAEVRKVK